MYVFTRALAAYQPRRQRQVLAMASNLPTMLINIWFSPLVAGYFSVVSRFCLSPVMIIGNAVRNSIFSKWSMDFRNRTFNYPEYKKFACCCWAPPRCASLVSGFSIRW